MTEQEERQNANDLLRDQLHRTGSEIKRADVFAMLAQLAACSVAILFLGILMDHYLFRTGLSVAGRLVLFLFLCLTCLVIVLRRAIPIFRRRVNPLYAAKVLEGPQGNRTNAMINWLELCGKQSGDDSATSSLRKNVLEGVARQAAHEIRELPDETLVDHSSVIRWTIAFACLTGLFLAYTLFAAKSPLQSITRILCPTASIAAPQEVRFLNIMPGNTTLFAGEILSVQAEIAGVGSRDVSFCFRSRDGRLVDQFVPMNAQGGNVWSLDFPSTTQGMLEPIDYEIVVGREGRKDNSSDSFTVDLRSAISFVTEKIVVVPPAYTGKQPEISEDSGDIHALFGSQVTLTARANTPLAKALFLPGKQENRAKVMTIDSLQSSVASFEFSVVWDENNTVGNEPVFPGIDSYRLVCSDLEGNRNRNEAVWAIEIQKDLPPLLDWVQVPDGVAQVPLNGKLAFTVRALDPDFGLADVTVHLAQREEQGIAARNEPERTFSLLPGASSADSIQDGDFISISGEQILPGSFVPVKLQLAVGQQYEYWVTARDNALPEPNQAQTAKKLFVVLPSDENKNGDESGEESGNESGEEKQGEGGQGEGEQGESKSGENNQGKGKSEEGEKSGQGESGQSESGQGESSQQNESGQGESGQSQSGQGESQQGQSSQGQSGESSGDNSDNSEDNSEGFAQSQDAANENRGENQGENASNQGDSASNSQGASSDSSSDSPAGSSSTPGSTEQNGGQNNGDNSTGSGTEQGNGQEAGQGNEQGAAQGNDSNNDSNTESENTNGTGPGTSGEEAPDEQRERQQEGQGESSKKESPIDPESNPGDAFEKILEHRDQELEKGQGEATGYVRDPAPGEGERTPLDEKEYPQDLPQDLQQRQGNLTQKDHYMTRDTTEKQAANAPQADDNTDVTDNPDGARGVTTTEEPRGDSTGTGKNKSDNNDSASASGQTADPNEQGKGWPQTGNPAANQSNDPSGQSPGNEALPATTPPDSPGTTPPSNGATPEMPKGSDTPGMGQSPSSPQGEPGSDSDEPNGSTGPGDGNGSPKSTSENPYAVGGGHEGTGTFDDQGNISSADSPNLAYTQQATELALEYLEDQLKEGVDHELLDELGWNEEQLRSFHDKWKKMEEKAKKSNATEQDRVEYLESLRNIGLRKPADEGTRQAQEGLSDAPDDRKNEESRRTAPPAALRDRFRAYNKGISRSR